MIERAIAALACGAALLFASAGPTAAQVPADAKFVGPPSTAADEARAAEAEMPPIDFATPVGDLEEAIRRAYWHNPRVLAERARKRSIDHRLAQARALYGPSIDYQFEYGYRRDRIELLPDRFRTASGWTSTVSAIVDQPLLTFGRLAANERRAEAEIGFERETLRFVEQQTLFDAIEAYVAVLRERNALRIAEDNLALLERELRDSEARQAAREVTIVDRRQVEARHELAAAELAIARGNLVASEGLFLAVIGSPPAAELAPPNPLLLPVGSMAEAIDTSLEGNPLVGAAQYRELVSRAALDGAIAERFPRLDLRGRADLAPVSQYDDRLRQTSYIGQFVLSGPLFTNGLLSARQKEAEAANDADWRLVDATRRDLIGEVSAAWSSWESSGDALDNLAAAVAAARAAYDGAVLQQKAGLRTTLDVLILSRELLTVRNSLNATEAQNYLAQARILFALGLLDLPYLMPAQPYYDADAHFDKVEVPVAFPPAAIVQLIDRNAAPDDEPRPTRDPAIGGSEAAGD